MKVLYEGEDISNDIDVKVAIATDAEGGIADTIRLRVADVAALWSKWEPKRGDKLRLTEDKYDTGTMYIDDIALTGDECALGAVSVNPLARAENFQSWENITFKRLLGDFAKRYNLKLAMYDAPNPTYGRVAQYGGGDLAWLARRCQLEGCQLKLHDGKMVVYGEHAYEKKRAVHEIELTDNTKFQYRALTHMLRCACVVESSDNRGRFDAPKGVGPVMHVRDVAAGSIAEAERFAKGILRNQNKLSETLQLDWTFDSEMAAGETIDVTGRAGLEGTWFLSAVRHDLIAERSLLTMRRPLGW
ncbi:phage late control D family protein [Bacillota bacterium Meth-B3]